MNRVIREKNGNYTHISNVFVRDDKLSLRAKGLLAQVMCLPSDWDFTIRGLCSIIKEGRDALYSTINELKNNGYCQFVVCRDEHGKIIGTDYTFYESPYTEKPYTGKPYTDNPDTENPPQINKEINKDLTKKDISPYNTPQGEIERLQEELAEVRCRLSVAEEQNNSLKEENDKLKTKKSKKVGTSVFDVMADLSYVEPEYYNLWIEWLRYKNDIKDQYKTSDGVVKGYTHFKKLSGGDIDKAKEIVDQSIRNNWKGLFDVKEWKKPQTTQQETKSSDGYNWQS